MTIFVFVFILTGTNQSINATHQTLTGIQIRYSIYSGDPDGYFSIDPLTGVVLIASPLDHETKPQVLLNVLATSGDPPDYGHTQVSGATSQHRIVC